MYGLCFLFAWNVVPIISHLSNPAMEAALSVLKLKVASIILQSLNANSSSCRETIKSFSSDPINNFPEIVITGLLRGSSWIVSTVRATFVTLGVSLGICWSSFGAFAYTMDVSFWIARTVCDRSFPENGCDLAGVGILGFTLITGM